MTSKKVAFITSSEFPDLLADDLLIVDALKKFNITVIPTIWDDATIKWQDFDLVVVRSPWDYYLKADKYAQCLQQFLGSETKLLNPPQAILDNIDKRYLLEFEKQGIPIIPSELVEKGSDNTLHDLINKRDWNKVVVKPVISAGAYGTWRSSLSTSRNDQEKFAEQISRETVLIQPFMPEIQNEGEWSIMYIDGQYAHSVLKKASGNDFRIQEEHGGTTQAIEPSAEILKQTQLIIDSQNEKLLYARVDGVIRNGQFLLMELEINEPSLFFEFSDKAASMFTEAIRSYLE